MLLTVFTWRMPTNPDPRKSMEIIVGALVFFSFAAVIGTVNPWIGLFFGLCIVWSRYPVTTPISLESLGAVFIAMVWFYVCVQLMNTPKRIDLILGIFCLIGLANVIMLSVQYFNCDAGVQVDHRIGLKSDDIKVGLMDCRNSVSALLAISLPAFFRKKWCYFIPFIILGLVLAKTTGGFISAGFVGATWLIYYLKRWTHKAILIFVIVCAVAGYITFIDVPGMVGRISAWTEAKTLFFKHPISGAGLGHWKVIFFHKQAKTLNTYYAQGHNEFIQVAVEMGILSIITIIGYFWSVIKRMRPGAVIPGLALLALCVDSLVFFPMHIWFLSILAVTWLAILEVTLNSERKMTDAKTG